MSLERDLCGGSVLADQQIPLVRDGFSPKRVVVESLHRRTLAKRADQACRLGRRQSRTRRPSPLDEDKQPSRLQELDPPSNRGCRIRQRPQDMPGENSVERCVRQRRGCRIAPDKIDGHASLLRLLARDSDHRCREVDAANGMPCLRKQHAQAARSAADVSDQGRRRRHQWEKERRPCATNSAVDQTVVRLRVERRSLRIPQLRRIVSHRRHRSDPATVTLRLRASWVLPLLSS